jgi:hypothetical protein
MGKTVFGKMQVTGSSKIAAEICIKKGPLTIKRSTIFIASSFKFKIPRLLQISQ